MQTCEIDVGAPVTDFRQRNGAKGRGGGGGNTQTWG